MSAVKGGMLPALIDYYERLEADPDESIAEYGFSREKIHFCAVLEADGTLCSARLVDIREQNNKGKRIPSLMLVPDGGGRAGSAIKPFFCWDNTGYVLGRDNKGKPKRAEQMFAAFRDLHLSMRKVVGDDEGYAALCEFLRQWRPGEAEALCGWDEAAGKNLVFKLRGRDRYVHQSEAVQRAWRATLEQSEPGDRGVSLISGDEDELARLHPLVSGVAGANTTGAAIVSFNLDAFTSYGKVQSYNAPVGVRDAFRYTTALNRLLADFTRRVRIGDATVIFWSDQRTEIEDWFAEVLDEKAEDPATVNRIAAFLRAARQGRLTDVVDDPACPFYVLGLSPNASRINVRFWLAGTVRQIAERLAEHVADVEMSGAREDAPPLILRALVHEAMPAGTASSRDRQVAQLLGEVARAVFTGGPYPQALFGGVLRRVRADQTMNHRRAATLKACIVRNARLRGRPKEVPVSLDKEQLEPAYHMGRLFAVFEYAQTNALGKINRTIKDSYFGTASVSPSTVFPRLMKLHQHHVENAPTDPKEARQQKKRTKRFFDTLVQEICSHFNRFPAHLPLEQQGMFHIGYYHQRQDFFTSNKNTADGETIPPTELEEIAS